MNKTLSIRSYLFLSQAILLATSLGAIGFIWSRNEYQVLTQELQNLMIQRVDLFSNVVGHEIAEHGSANLEDMSFPQVQLEENMSAVYIDNTGMLYELVHGTVTPNEADLFHQLGSKYYPKNGSISTLVRPVSEATNIYAAAPVFDAKNERIGMVCLLMPIGHLDAYIMRLRWLLMGAIIFVILLGVGGSSLLTNYFSRQFSRAEDLAATVASGDYHLRIPEEGPSELRNLSHSLNQMAEKLEEQLKTRRSLLANVAHELARPLAGLQLGIESLRKGAFEEDPNLADDLLVSMRQTILRFEALIDDITLAAHPQAKPIKIQRTSLAVEPILKGAATRFWSLARTRDIKLEVQIEANLPQLSADEKRLNQIIGNLMDNAIKFSAQGKKIILSAECCGSHDIRILVHDQGDGILSEDYDRIFEPFYQGDTGRRIQQGMGLGLAIAQQLARAHGGDLELKNHPTGGAVAILTLPAATS